MSKEKYQKKIITRLKGGLGNQLFLYATAYRLCHINKAKLIIDNKTGFDLDFKYKRKFDLNFMNISAPIASNKELMLPLFRIKRMIYRILFFLKLSNKREFYYQKGINFDTNILKYNFKAEVLYYDGFGQSEDYFFDVKDSLKKEFSFKSANQLKKFTKKNLKRNAVALHLRFFDSNNYNSQINLKDDYYKMAIYEISSKIKNPTFYIFSDNTKFAKRRVKSFFKKNNYVFVSDLEKPSINNFDFQLMTSCDHFITANSSFSWWAAWLGESNTSLVYVPGITLDENNISSWGFKNLIPKRWITL